MAITFPIKEYVATVQNTSGQPVSQYLQHGFCLPDEVIELPTGTEFANGSDVTVIGGGTVYHYNAAAEMWVDFLASSEEAGT